MCGIAGILQLDDGRLDYSLLEAMTTALAHRGPDGEGYVLLAPGNREKPLAVIGKLSDSVRDEVGLFRVGLGHRRLAIIDLSPLGHQPMGTDDGLLWITYNGEVYNAPELRRELMAAGSRFRSATDTEVVLESYRHWGPSCLGRLNGMFAFALWDERARTLFCVRDRFGIKPFYYRHDGSRFMFASEIKALLQDPACPRTPNHRAIHDYLTEGRQDHSTETFFQGIHQLTSGECLTVHQDRSGRAILARERWWRPAAGTEAMCPVEAAVRMRELTEDSVRVALRADVSIGSCLSGGLDSSTIVCLMSRLIAAGTLQTFSFYTQDPRYDERPYIRAVQAQTGVTSHEVSLGAHALAAILPDVLWHQDEPFGGTSILAQWQVMQTAARAGIKVLLDGQGADELLLGYPRYIGSKLADLIRHGHWGTGIREWRAWRRVHGGLPQAALANLAQGLLPHRLVQRLRARMTGAASWLDPQFARDYGNGCPTTDFPAEGLSVLSAHRLRTLVQDLPALLHFADRNAMAFSVEARLPFLDHRLVEWLLRLPPELQLRDGITKRVLRDAMVEVLPEEVRLRTDKIGFATPEDHWLRNALRSEIEAALHSDSMRSRPYWRMPVLKEWYRRYCNGQLSIGPTVWRWVNLEWWLRRFCD